jgi:hypothetical protein
MPSQPFGKPDLVIFLVRRRCGTFTLRVTARNLSDRWSVGRLIWRIQRAGEAAK